MPRGLHKFSYLTRDQTRAPAGEAQSLNNWTAREVCPFYCTEYWFSIKKKEARKGDREARKGDREERRQETRDRRGKCVITVVLLRTGTPWAWILFNTEEFFSSAHILMMVIAEEGASVFCLFIHLVFVLSNKLVKIKSLFFFNGPVILFSSVDVVK